jgi:hypothetical protein
VILSHSNPSIVAFLQPWTIISTGLRYEKKNVVLLLVDSFNHLEKSESQWEGLSHIFWKIKAMFETTNQY